MPSNEITAFNMIEAKSKGEQQFNCTFFMLSTIAVIRQSLIAYLVPTK